MITACELCGRSNSMVISVSGIWCHLHCWRQRRRKRDKLLKDRNARRS